MRSWVPDRFTKAKRDPFGTRWPTRRVRTSRGEGGIRTYPLGVQDTARPPNADSTR